MFRREKKRSHPGERILFETRPRSIIHLKSSIFKFILILLILYFFSWIRDFFGSIQLFLLNYVQIPLVQTVVYILFLIMLLLLLWIILDVISWRYTRYILSNYRVMIKKGIVWKKKAYIHHDKIQDIIISQSLMQRILSAGDMEIFGGHEHTPLLLKNIPHPAEVENMINRLIEGEELVSERYRKPKSRKSRKSIIEEYDKKFRM